MKRESATTSLVLCTVGHSNHLFEAFVDLLRNHGIQMVADVRSSPYSRHAAQFNKETLESRLPAEGLSYRFLGHVLGGRPQDTRFYDPEGYVLYDRIAASSAFQQEITALLEQAIHVRTAVLCGEEDPRECHRRLLLGRVASERGYEIRHLRGDGRMQNEASMAEEERFQKTKGQLSLFDAQDEKPWRSARRVAREKRPSGSSL
jgi:uncharacterized protein (DUF488 family)